MPDDPEETPPYGIGALGAVRLLRDLATVPDEAPTGEYCPACANITERGELTPGDGIIRLEDSRGRHHATQCTLCNGNGWCSARDATDWRIRNLASGTRVRPTDIDGDE